MVKEDRWVNSRGLSLHFESHLTYWKPKALLVFHHGYGEHVGRYRSAFADLAEAGVVVYAFDAHGQGRSDPSELRERALVQDFQHLVEDCQAFSTLVRWRHPPNLPAFIGGQSLGGLVALHVALADQSLWRGILLCSAAVDIEWTLLLRVQASVGGLLASLVPRSRIVPAVRPDDMSTDPETVRGYKEDPLNIVGNVPAQTGFQILQGMRQLQGREAAFHLPIYAHHGSHDKCTSLPAVKRFVEAASSRDKTLTILDGSFHELVVGPERVQTVPAMTSWILARCATSKL
ncbi:hypothetical protein WJX74_008874 [Apatococcus lobatus]|uniref:Serine aminopeptidase S33 domain-containing protein n=1 Tax=Apatococcus lobatus TaxID=904363 RepID=A0AAW1QW60_9CHLO